MEELFRRLRLFLFCILSVVSISVNGQDPQDCPPITVETLGSPSMLSSDGLISSVFSATGDNTDLPDVQITRINVVCEVAGSVFNTSRGVSVLVQYDCNSDRGDLPECTSAVDSIIRQFQFGCTDNQWVASVAGSDIFVESSSTTATFATLLADRCGLCIDPLQSAPTADDVTHCDACHTNCDSGQERCFGTGPNECCNFYFNGMCVAECPNGLTGNNDFICGCPLLNDPPSGSVDSTGVALFGETATYTCIENYRLVGVGTRTCTPNGWDGVEPTCRAIVCPDDLLDPEGGSVGYSASTLIVGSTADYVCEDGRNLVGNRVRTCVNNNGVGEWTGSDPMCVECVLGQIPNCAVCTYRNGETVCTKCSESEDEQFQLSDDGKECNKIDSKPGGSSGSCGTGCIIGIVVAILAAVILSTIVAVVIFALYKYLNDPATKLAKTDTEGLNGVARDNPLYVDPTVLEDA